MTHRASWLALVSLLVLALAGMPLAACSPADQPALATAAAEVVKTAESAARTSVAAEAQTAVAAAATKVLGAGQTAVSAAETRAAAAAQTQVAALKTRVAGASPTPGSSATPLPGAYTATFRAPYQACDTQSDHTPSPDPGSWDLLEKGFSQAFATCDAGQGGITAGVLAFGTRGGNIFKHPDQQAHASGQMSLEIISPFSGRLRIEAELVVSADLGAAAGSATALPDIQDLLKEILIKNEIIKGFVEIAEGFILGTFAGAKGEAYLTAESNGKKHEVRAIAGDHGVGASFPIPPWRQTRTLREAPVTLILEVPVQEGEPVEIAVGVAAQALTRGWASAYWNPWKKHQAQVTQVVLTEQ